MSTKLNTPEFRVAFPNVFRPKKNTLNGNEEYSVVALFPKGTDLSDLKAAARAAIEKKFGKDKSKWPTTLKNPFKDQGSRAKKDPVTGKETLPQGYEKGCIYIDLKSQDKPGVVDQGVNNIINTSDFYGGCWAVASVNAFGYDQGGNKGVSFGLGNIQKVRDDSGFGNRTRPEDDFAPVAESTEETSETSASELFT